MKKIISVCVIILLLGTMALPVFAAQGNEIQPLYNNIATIVVGLRIDKDTSIAYCTGSVDSYYQVPVEVLVQLQVYTNGTWTTLMSWSNADIGTASLGGQYTVTPGYNYRTRVTGSICNDWGIPIESETETKEVYYPAS